MKKFEIPVFYRSSFIGKIKEKRKITDPRKKDFSPTVLDFGDVQFLIARHFGFCYGVENAIEISYKTIEENPNKRIFLLSQMIHNPDVNNDLISRGLQFIMDTEGNQFVPWESLRSDDIVIIPAFGTTLAIEKKLQEIGIQTEKYNTTCPFVEKVWNTSKKIGEKDFSIIIHGKFKHEETRASFSHAAESAASVVIYNMDDAKIIGDILLGKRPQADFYTYFGDKCTQGFDVEKDLVKVGVVNQTTMLASETHAIAEYFKNVMIEKYGEDQLKEHFADTRDTLCYATNDNQEATYGLLQHEADLAIVVGGYNSSNTSHLVELCEEKFPTYFISGPDEILSATTIRHFIYNEKRLKETEHYLPKNKPLRIVLTSGASCPDSVVDAVLDKVLGFFEEVKEKETVLAEFAV
jgi:4-hydroxy-3-methylbut-2-enyl diphosphate reductase